MRCTAILAAAAVIGMTSGAFAAAATKGTIADQCAAYANSLPNVKWGFAWVETGSTTTTTIGDIEFSGNSGTGFADVTTETVTTGNCVAINPAGQPNADHSITGVEIVTDSTTEEHVKVCDTVGGHGSGGPTTEPAEGYPDAECVLPE